MKDESNNDVFQLMVACTVLGLAFGILFGAFLGKKAGIKAGTKHIQQEAIDNGHAHYNPTNALFEWNKNN